VLCNGFGRRETGSNRVQNRADRMLPEAITDLYRWHDVARLLDEDADKLVGFLVGSLG